MTRSRNNPWLHRFALLTAASTLFLIWVGGLVTSHGVGMAVPDWPTTYGYNMFFFPFSQWVGGVFYEHSHRLIASSVGMLTAILAGWIWFQETTGWMRRCGLAGILTTLGLMGVRKQGMFVALAVVAVVILCFSLARLRDDQNRLRWLAAVAFCTVLVQGVLGGLRVTAMKDEIGILHGTLAQMFFALLCVIALLTSGWWRRVSLTKMNVYGSDSFRYVFALVTGMILVQLIIGAAMRHQHAGLAISDFPLAHGKLWPAMDAGSVARYNQARGEMTATNPITAFQIGLHMAHRIVALVILLAVAWVSGLSRRKLAGTTLSRGAALWLALIIAQASLGALTIWTNKAADIATAHVVLGALSLVTGVVLSILALRCVETVSEKRLASVPSSASSTSSRSATQVPA